MFKIRKISILVLICFSSILVSADVSETLYLADVGEFLPTQLVAGYEEIEKKEKKILKLNSVERVEYYKENAIPVVMGPNKKMYMIDHHHFLAAAYRVSTEKVYYKIAGDFSKLKNLNEFWKKMKEKKWVYLKQNGVSITTKDLPNHISKLVNDPYRAFTAEARDAGAFEKTNVPFAEFMWADYYRIVIPLSLIKENRPLAIQTAINISSAKAMSYLPGHKSSLACIKDCE